MTNEELQKIYIKADMQYDALKDNIHHLEEENKQLKEELENDIDRYEDTISYQLGFDKGKEYLQQRIDKAIEYIKNNWYSKNTRNIDELHSLGDWRLDLLEILGDKENE